MHFIKLRGLRILGPSVVWKARISFGPRFSKKNCKIRLPPLAGGRNKAAHPTDARMAELVDALD